MKFHPLADLFPLLEGEEFAALVEDVRAHGLREPIWLHPDGSILDGRNRYRACIEASVEPRFRTYDGGDPLAFVISANIKRRHLDASQRAIIAARLANRPEGRPSKTAPIGAVSIAEAAKLFSIGEGTIDRAKRVLRECTADVIAQIERGEVSVAGALKGQEDKPQPASRLIQQSLSNEHYTPPEYIEAARAVLGTIDLDPASCDEANEAVKATEYFSEEDDGLNQKWSGNIFLNPPYCGLAGKFIEKLKKELAESRVVSAIVLVNAHSTDAAWFQYLWSAQALCFTDHRIDFKGDDNRSGSTHGSVFAYFGNDVSAFTEHFQQFGRIIYPALEEAAIGTTVEPRGNPDDEIYVPSKPLSYYLSPSPPAEADKLNRGIAIVGRAVYLERARGLPQAKAIAQATEEVNAAFDAREKQAKLDRDKAVEAEAIARAKKLANGRKQLANQKGNFAR